MNRIINFYQRAKRKLLYIKNNYSFHINNYVTNLIYGNVPIKYYKFNTSEEDTEELKKIILNSKELDFLEDEEINFRFYKRKRFQNNSQDYEAYKDMSKYTTWFKLGESEYVEKYLRKVLPIIKEKLNSPCAIVNLRAWKSMANAKTTFHKGRARGAFRMHKDKMPPGHLKCMIYLNPLNNEYGKFQIEEDVIESEKPGMTILFKNSDLDHQAISGNKYFRILIEITIMRTFKNVDELKYYSSSPNSLYLNNAFYAYL